MGEQYVKNQHYIPQCLLKYFANSKDQVFECLVETGRIYPNNFRNSMSERFTYEHPKLEINKVERYFQKIESYIGSAIKKIIAVIDGYESGVSDFLEVKATIFQYMREFIIFYYRSGALLTEFEFHRQNKDDRVFLMLENIMNSNYIRELSKTIINHYDFTIIKSDNNEFIMSDQYVSTVALAIKNRFFNISNRHMGLKDIMILIPLSGKYYAIFYDGNIPEYISANKVNQLSEVQVDEINGIIINNSYKKSIGNNQRSLERVIPYFEYASPSGVFAGGNGVNMGATLKKEVFFYEKDRNAWEMFVNLNWTNYRELSRNNQCACGSGKKFKRCCIEYVNICERMYSDIVQKKENYRINDFAITEKGIAEFNKKD